MNDTIELDRGVAQEMLGFANTGHFLCESILKRNANAIYIVENEFAKWFQYMQEQLMPLLYPEDK